MSKHLVSFTLNDRLVETVSQPTERLSILLREQIGQQGTKVGCDAGDCGACTVLIDGAACCSCLVPSAQVNGTSITTIEGLSEEGLHPIQEAWIELDVPQCGYCQSGQIMAASALLSKKTKPSEDEISRAMAGIICRCGTYVRIKKAIQLAANKLEE